MQATNQDDSDGIELIHGSSQRADKQHLAHQVGDEKLMICALAITTKFLLWVLYGYILCAQSSRNCLLDHYPSMTSGMVFPGARIAVCNRADVAIQTEAPEHSESATCSSGETLYVGSL